MFCSEIMEGLRVAGFIRLLIALMIHIIEIASPPLWSFLAIGYLLIGYSQSAVSLVAVAFCGVSSRGLPISRLRPHLCRGTNTPLCPCICDHYCQCEPC